jgi:hypothetical protein
MQPWAEASLGAGPIVSELLGSSGLSEIPMMQTTDHRLRGNESEIRRLDRSVHGAILVQSQVSPRPSPGATITRITEKSSIQVRAFELLEVYPVEEQ